MTQIPLSETWENLRQVFKAEVHVLGFCCLQTSNWDGEESELFSSATTIHGIARILESSTQRIQLKLLTYRVQTKIIQLSKLWYRLWQWWETSSHPVWGEGLYHFSVLVLRKPCSHQPTLLGKMQDCYQVSHSSY